MIIDSSFSTRLIIDSQNHKTKINNMKRTFIIIAAMMLTMITASAKKVTVTIDGTVYRTQEKIYLIVDEDTANAVVVPVQNGQFTVTTTVDANSIIRLHETKEWPERAEFVIIPDSKHITADLNSSTIEGSPMSQRLRTALSAIKSIRPTRLTALLLLLGFSGSASGACSISITSLRSSAFSAAVLALRSALI